MDVKIDNVLRERWDDVARTYTRWDANGVQTLTRPYTAEENARADAEAQAITQNANLIEIDSKLVTVDLVAMQAILDQTNAAIRSDPSQEIKDLAVTCRRLIRKVERLLDGTG